MSILAKKIYFDIYNLENDLKSKELIVQEYQELFDEYIMNYREDNKTFANTYNEIDELNSKFVQKEFDKTKTDIDARLKDTSHAQPTLKDKSTDESKLLPSVVRNYREVVKLTHPDVTVQSHPFDVEKQQEYTQLYLKATNYYNDNQLYGLMLINKMVGNNPFSHPFTEADIENLKNKKDDIESKVNDIKDSFIWNFMQIDDETKLNDFISNHFKNMLNKMR